MPRPARKYSRRVEFWASTPTDDAFGGKILQDALVKTLWAEVDVMDAEKSELNGIERGVLGIQVFCRKDPGVDWANETLFLKIGGKEYRIVGLKDVDLMALEMEITATT